MRDGGRRPSGRTLAARTLVVAALLAVVACVPPRPSASLSPSQAATVNPTAPVPAGWTDHELDGGVHLALPSTWLVLRESDLADAAVLAEIRREFAGADALFGQLAAQGRSARIVLLAIDPAARNTGRFPPIVSVVAVEPALPRLLLGIGADFAVSALENAFAIETDVEQADMATPLGEGVRIGFEHRVALSAAGGPGARVEHDGVLVTTGAVSYLVSRSVATDDGLAGTPTLETVVDTLRVER